MPPNEQGCYTRPLKAPAYLKRRVVWYIVAMVVLGLAPALLHFVLQRQVPLWAYVASMALPGMLSGFIGVWYSKAMRREVRRAQGIGGRVCWNCGYALTGLAPSGACPECGGTYEVSELRRLWNAPPQGATARPGG